MFCNFHYSNIVIIKREGQSLLISKITPNPFSEKIVITIVVDTNQPLTINLYDITGKIVNKKSVDLVKGSNRIEITNISYLQKGIYVIEASNNSLKIVSRLLKDK